MTDCTSCKAASALDGLPCPWAGHDHYPPHPRGCHNVEKNPRVWIPETVRIANLRASEPALPSTTGPKPDPSLLTLPILPACPHRGAEQGCCSATMTCDLRGNPKQVNAQTCNACPVPSWRKWINDPVYLDRIMEFARQGNDHVAVTESQPPPRAARPTVNIHESLSVIHECDYRGPIVIPRCGCQGEYRLCGLGKGDPSRPGHVSIGDCLECVKPKAPIRLGILSPGCYTGGAEMWMLSLLANLDRSRFTPSGVAIRYSQHIDSMVHGSLSNLCPVGVGDEAVDALWQNSDVVLVWGVPAWDQRMPPRPRRAKAVLVSHGVGPWTVPIFADPDSADGWVAVSDAARDPIPESHKARAVVLANGVDLDRLKASESGRETIRRRLGVSASQRLVVYLGRVSDEKNPRAFLECAAESERRWPGRFAFAVVGDGFGLSVERAYAAERAPHVSWPGVQRNVGDWLSAADHVMMTSHEEADSLTLLESFAAGKPVVSTRVGRLREPEYAALARVVDVKPTGAILADALDLDATDPNVSARVVKARDIARTRHSAGAMAGRWMEYLACLMKP